MKQIRPGREGSRIWLLCHSVSILFLCFWVYWTIRLQAPWLFPLFGGVALCKAIMDFAAALRRRKMRSPSDGTEDNAGTFARVRFFSDTAYLMSVAVFLTLWEGAALYIALTSEPSPLAWFFPIPGLFMMLMCAPQFVAHFRARPGKTPPKPSLLVIVLPDLLFACVGVLFAVVWLTVAVPAGAPWAACLVCAGIIAVGVARAVYNIRKFSAQRADADGENGEPERRAVQTDAQATSEYREKRDLP